MTYQTLPSGRTLQDDELGRLQGNSTLLVMRHAIPDATLPTAMREAASAIAELEPLTGKKIIGLSIQTHRDPASCPGYEYRLYEWADA